MMMPSIFGENLFDDRWFGFPFERDFFGDRRTAGLKPSFDMMKTDVKENENGYEVDIDLPGVQKENIHAELNNGYLTISASSSSENDEKDGEGRYIRRERYSGSVSRSFYVGKALTQEDIKAKYENGILKLAFPKKEKQPAEEKKYIAIEGE